MWFSVLWRLLKRILRILVPFRRAKDDGVEKCKEDASQIYTVTSLDMLANQHQEAASDVNHAISVIVNPLPIENKDTKHQMVSMSTTAGDMPYYDERSKWEAMRLKKHFTVQSSLMLKENETTYVGAFAVSTELRTVKKSPLSCTNIAEFSVFTICTTTVVTDRVYACKECYISVYDSTLRQAIWITSCYYIVQECHRRRGVDSKIIKAIKRLKNNDFSLC
ncbi:mannose-1-phosphate guanyltransferase beta [Acrasis kona]|uniref:Mannose-1-phosphate guanyltransferase beta n=1 Tax=Acrasis kona TaxID=1008807 RepID=A0AAW2ZJA3_9EUKA